MIMSSTHWPAWSIDREPADLARYVVPDEVARLVPIPGTSGEPVLTRLNTAWEELRSRGVGYVREPEASAAGRPIRTPGEVLGTPRNATGLDIALVLAGACEHAGLASAILVVDPKQAGQPQHALVAVLLGQVWPPEWQDTADRPETLDELAGQVRVDVRSPERDVAVLDPVGLTHSLGMSTAAGTDQSLEQGAAAGHRYLTSGEWVWGTGIVTGRRADAFVPAQVPAVLPLAEIYRKPETAEPALRLVRPEFEVTPFESREELTILTEICAEVEAGHRTEIIIVHGKGGSGKTRLALELAERLRREGWYAGPLKEQLTEAEPTSLVWLAQVTAPLLVVVDDADARVGETQALVRALQNRPGTPAVVLLTAQSLDGDWFETIQGDQSATAHPLVFEALALPDTHPQTEEIFRSTFTAVSTAQAKQGRESHSAPAAEAHSLPVVAATVRWTTLDLVLLGWLAAQDSTDLPTTPGNLYDEVLTHESRYWADTFTDVTGQRRANQDVLSEAGAVLTLLRPTAAGANQALQVLESLSQGELRDQVTRTMTTCTSSGAGERLAIRPDLVGDHHLLKVLSDQPDLLHRCLPIGTPPEALLAALLVLNRAGQNDATAVAGYLADLVRAEPERWPTVLAVASALGGPAQTALETLVAAEDCPLPLDKLSEQLPEGATGLWRLAMLVDDRRLRSADPSDVSRRAALLLEVSSRHAAAGDRAGALAAIEEATASYRELAAGDPAAFTHHLAGSLNNLSVQRAAAGDRDGALTAIEEATASYRELVGANSAAFTPDLAMSLNNVSVQRAAAGDRVGALAAIEEAAASYRELVAANPAAFTHHLAMSLNNVSVQRTAVGDREGALAAIEEASASYRELAAANPAAFTHHLAMSLNTLSIQRAAAGDREGTLAAIEEAAASYRELAAANPAAFSHPLAMSLNNLSVQRAAAGDREGALAAIEEAAASYRELAAADPAAFTHPFAMSLNNLSVQRAAAGDREGALTAVGESVALRRELAAADPGAFTPDLATSLNNLSNGRAAAGDREGALAAIEEAVALRRELAATNPAAFNPDLAMSLNNLSLRRAEAGDREGSLDAMEEAAASYRKLAEADPTAFTPDLAMLLNNLSVQRSAAKDQEGALAAIEEAVALRRELAAAYPAVFTHHLAGSLNNLSVQRAEVGDQGRALAAIEEAVALRRKLAAADPGAFIPDLAISLNNLSAQRSAAEDREGALAAAEEAAAAYRQLAAADPAAFTANLARSLTSLSAQRAEAGDRSGALAAVEEAAASYRELAAADPAAFTADLAMSLNNLAPQRAAAGDRDGALKAIGEAAASYRELAAADPAAFTADLASSLNNLAAQRVAAGDRDGALSAIEEAVASYRELVAADPAFAADLAGSLNNLSNGRAEAGDRAGALSAIEEAVPYYRERAAADPAAFAASLAGSLNNLSGRRLEAGDRDGALSAIEEAVDLHRELASGDPAAHTSDLAASSNLMADQLAEAGHEDQAVDAWEQSRAAIAVPQFRASITAATAAWLVRRGDRAQAEVRIRQSVDEALDPTVVEPTADGASSDTDFAVGESRRYLRSVVMSMSPVPEGLPGWVSGPIPDLDLDLVRAWGDSTTWSEGATVLREHSTVATGPSLSETLVTLLMLHPGDQRLTGLAAVHKDIVERGLSPVLEDLTTQDELQILVDDWINTDTWTASLTYLGAHVERLRTDEVVQRLAALQTPTALQHAAILTLWATTTPQQIEELLTDASVAADLALDAVEAGDLGRVHLLTFANPHTLQLPGTGPMLQAVLLLAAGDHARAASAAKTAAETATEDQRRAHTIRLGRLAKHAEAVRGGTAGVTALIDAYTASIPSPLQNNAETGPPGAPLPPEA